MGATQSSPCIISPLEYPAMMDKLKKSCQQRINCTRNSFRKKKCPNPLKSKLIEPMPRCSSFGCSSAMLTPTKKPINDPTYTMWKQTFEQKASGVPQKPLAAKRRVHDISEAVSGQLTPKGFPSYTKVVMPKTPTRQHNGNAKPNGNSPLRVNETFLVETKLRRRLSLRLPMFKSNSAKPSEDVKVKQDADVVNVKRAAAISNCNNNNNNNNIVKNLMMAKTPVKAKPYYLSKVSKKQAIIIEKLYQEIKDLEDYYGMRLDYYYY